MIARLATGAVAALAALLPYQPAAAQPPISHMGRIFASQVLGPERAAQVERLEAVPFFMAPTATRIRFYYPAAPLGNDLCQRTGHETMVSFEPVRPDAQLTDLVEIALAPGCRLESGQPFALVERRVPVEAAAAMLRAVKGAQVAAATGGPLPFDLSCEDEFNIGCADAGRTTLAALPIDQARLVGGDRVYVARPWEAGWTVAVTRQNGKRSVRLRRERPVPF